MINKPPLIKKSPGSTLPLFRTPRAVKLERDPQHKRATRKRAWRVEIQSGGVERVRWG